MSGRVTRSSTKRKADDADQTSKAPARDQKRGAKQKKQKTVHEQFMDVIAAKEKQLKKHCIIMEMVETDEDETTLEALQQLKRVFVPNKVQDDFIEIWSELDDVGQESEEEGEEDESDGLAAFMAAFMGKFLSTQHAAQMHTILNNHLKAVDKAIKSKAWQEAFCRWAALVMAARRESHWWEDTDTPKAAEAIYKKLRDQWVKLKARSDEELGGLVSEGEHPAKEEFDAYLQLLADEMKEMDYAVQDVV